ncbi:TPA: hypothetical protein ACGZ9P_004233, partial [Escherichia coli]
ADRINLIIGGDARFYFIKCYYIHLSYPNIIKNHMAFSVQQNHTLSPHFRGGSVVHIMFFPTHENVHLGW